MSGNDYVTEHKVKRLVAGTISCHLRFLDIFAVLENDFVFMTCVNDALALSCTTKTINIFNLIAKFRVALSSLSSDLKADYSYKLFKN